MLAAAVWNGVFYPRESASSCRQSNAESGLLFSLCPDSLEQEVGGNTCLSQCCLIPENAGCPGPVNKTVRATCGVVCLLIPADVLIQVYLFLDYACPIGGSLLQSCDLDMLSCFL